MKKSQLVSQVFKKSFALLTTFSSVVVFAQTAEPTATSTTTTATVATPAPANKFGLTLVNATANNFDAARTKGGADTENSITLSYKAMENLKLGATLVNEYSFVGRGEDQNAQKANYRDLCLSATTTHGGVLGTKETPVKYKFNLPTSQASKDAKQAFSLGAEVTLGYELASNLSANVLLVPGWYLKNGAADELKNQTNAELRYAHTSKLSTYGFLDHKIKAITEANLPKLTEIGAVGMGVSFSPNKIIDLDLSVARERHIAASTGKNKSKEFTFLDAKEISYTAGAVLKF